MNQYEFQRKGEYVIKEVIKKFDDPNTKETFKVCAEAFLEEFKAYLFKESEVKK